MNASSSGYPTAELVCPEGYYCPQGTAHYTDHPCTAGTYNALQKQVSNNACLTCTAGYYCPEATGNIGLVFI